MRGIITTFATFFVMVIVVVYLAPAQAQDVRSWDGIWSGKWDGALPASITIKDGRVSQYVFKDIARPITKQSISGSAVSFGNDYVSFTMTRMSPTSSTVKYVTRTGRTGSAIFEMTPTPSAQAKPAAAPKNNSWDGTWSGKWGGKSSASITIVDGQVAQYLFRGTSQAFAKQNITDEVITFGNNYYTITLSKLSASSSAGQYKNEKGENSAATFKLTAATEPQVTEPKPWEGTWVGKWGGKNPVSVTILKGRVVQYLFKGEPQAFASQDISRSSVKFGNDFYTITMTRLNTTTAAAQYNNTKGETGVATLSTASKGDADATPERTNSKAGASGAAKKANPNSSTTKSKAGASRTACPGGSFTACVNYNLKLGWEPAASTGYCSQHCR